jgi:peptide/nickel transport system permease protein
MLSALLHACERATEHVRWPGLRISVPARVLARAAAPLVTGLLAFTLSFVLVWQLPASAAETVLRESGASPAAIAERRARLGLDRPPLEQWASALAGLVRGDLGVSLLDGVPVRDRLATAIPYTLELAGAAVAVGVLIGTAAGLARALHPRAAVRGLAEAWMTLALSIPIYWSGTLTLAVFSAWLGWFPASGGGIAALILPALLLGAQLSGAIASVTAQAAAAARDAAFTTTAHAKGLRRRTITARHILRASLAPIIGIVGVQVGFALSSTAITESVFNRPGVGRLLVDAVLRGDYPVVHGVLVFAAFAYWLSRAAAAWAARLADPRAGDEP